MDKNLTGRLEIRISRDLHSDVLECLKLDPEAYSNEDKNPTVSQFVRASIVREIKRCKGVNNVIQLQNKKSK